MTVFCFRSDLQQLNFNVEKLDLSEAPLIDAWMFELIFTAMFSYCSVYGRAEETAAPVLIVPNPNEGVDAGFFLLLFMSLF